MAAIPHILVVDDERDIRDPLAAYLARNGLRVTKAESAAARAGCSPPTRSTSSFSTS
jgi:DNA-binding response OmpR family regulator